MCIKLKTVQEYPIPLVDDLACNDRLPTQVPPRCAVTRAQISTSRPWCCPEQQATLFTVSVTAAETRNEWPDGGLQQIYAPHPYGFCADLHTFFTDKLA